MKVGTQVTVTAKTPQGIVLSPYRGIIKDVRIALRGVEYLVEQSCGGKCWVLESFIRLVKA